MFFCWFACLISFFVRKEFINIISAIENAQSKSKNKNKTNKASQLHGGSVTCKNNSLRLIVNIESVHCIALFCIVFNSSFEMRSKSFGLKFMGVCMQPHMAIAIIRC